MAIKTFRFDSRRRTLLLAIALLLAAALAVLALFQQSAATKVYLVANRDLAAGELLSGTSLRQAELSLGAEASAYVSALKPGMRLAMAVQGGELIPKRAVLAAMPAESKPLRVSPSTPLSARIRVGSLVQLWFVPKAINSTTVTTAVQLLAGAEVLAIHKSDATLGKQIDDVEVSVPTESLNAVITAIASAGFVSVVSES